MDFVRIDKNEPQPDNQDNQDMKKMKQEIKELNEKLNKVDQNLKLILQSLQNVK